MESLYQNKIRNLILDYFQLIETGKNINFSLYDAEYQIALLDKEKEVLDAFQLPHKIKYFLFLFHQANKLLNHDFRIEQLYYELSVCTEEIESENKKDKFTTLQEAKQNEASPFDILPDISVTPHSYTLFIYHEIFLKNEARTDEVWTEFQLLKRLDCLNEIYLLCFDPSYKKNHIFLKLQAAGLQFLQFYLEWHHIKTTSCQ